MATVNDIKNDPNYIVVHEHGFVGIVDHMGDDSSICQAARVSYGKGTKSSSDDRGLIRYLLRHQHTTPTEMCEIKFHMKLPIFVARQLVRHRTANINEYSGRYSEMPDEFYIPSDNYLQAQSQTNKQGRSGEIEPHYKNWIKSCFEGTFRFAFQKYQLLMNPGRSNSKDEIPQTCIADDDYPGLTRELSRIVLPLANYTEWYWKIDLHNLFRFLKLRLDSHAQQEIRDFANAMYKLIKPLYPIACEAFEDYINQSKTFSRMELELLKDLIYPDGKLFSPAINFDEIKRKGEILGMSKREIDEFNVWITQE